MKQTFLSILMLLFPLVASADDSGTCGDNLTWTFVESTGTLTISGSGYVPTYFSSEYIPWANYKNIIKKVVIQDGVISIGDKAFSGCTILNSVTIPNSVLYLGKSIFEGCSSLTSITIPDGVTDICNYSFYGCSNLSSINLPNQLSNIWEGAFRGCSGLTSIIIPKSVATIDGYAFFGCSSLTSIVIPKSVNNIGRNVFSGCANLTSISVESGNSYYDSRNNCNAIINSISNTLVSGCMNTVIPSSVTKIGYSAFRDCTGLKSIIFHSNLTTIEEDAFWGCTGLTSLTIPSSITSIGPNAFAYCNIKSLETHYKKFNIVSLNSLENLVIGAEVTTITIGNEYDVYSSPNLTSIIVESGNPNYDSRNDCNALIETSTNTLLKGCSNSILPDGVITIDRGAFFQCKGLTSINIPNSVTTIKNLAFQSCSNVTSITIGKNVSSIDLGAFAGCSKLASITVSSENPNYDSRNNCNAIIHTRSNALIAGCKNTIIPDNITTIVPVAFAGCTGLTNVVLPNSITEIYEDAFTGCTSLTSISIGSSVTSIMAGAFRECTGLTDFYCLTENVPSTNANAFKDSPIDHATLHVPAASISLYSQAAPWNGFKSIVEHNDNTPVLEKCATPTISYNNGKLAFSCATDGVEFVSEITSDDIKKHSGNEISLTKTYKVSVYATKEGYANSDVATKEIKVDDGDLDDDNTLSITDVVILIDKIMKE